MRTCNCASGTVYKSILRYALQLVLYSVNSTSAATQLGAFILCCISLYDTLFCATHTLDPKPATHKPFGAQQYDFSAKIDIFLKALAKKLASTDNTPLPSITSRSPCLGLARFLSVVHLNSPRPETHYPHHPLCGADTDSHNKAKNAQDNLIGSVVQYGVRVP
eukprot:1191934-Prorocentrum_minimum.AAC.7